MDTCTHKTHPLPSAFSHTDAHSLPFSHTLPLSQHTCYCLSTKAVLYCESTNSEGKHEPYGGNGRREVLKQINTITCLMNFPIFPWGEDEVKGTSAHLPGVLANCSLFPILMENSSPFLGLTSQWPREAEPGNVSCLEELNIMQQIPEYWGKLRYSFVEISSKSQIPRRRCNLVPIHIIFQW